MKLSLSFSYDHCQQIAKQAASNFYFAFYLLPAHKRRAMFALYAFLRRTDDLGDSAEPLELRKEQLTQWRDALQFALAGDFRDPILPAMVDTLREFNIPPEYLFAVLDGVEMDLTHKPFETEEELARYCYHVASVVGMACIHIWGFDDPAALPLAETCGQAFQLTNILRDLQEDASRERVYLPRQIMDRFGYSADDLKQQVVDERFKKLIAYEVGQAAEAYGAVEPLCEYLTADGKRALAALSCTYFRLLQKIAANPAASMQQRVHLRSGEKLRILCGSTLSPGKSIAMLMKQRSSQLLPPAQAQAETP